jgi:hypothetical protein
LGQERLTCGCEAERGQLILWHIVREIQILTFLIVFTFIPQRGIQEIIFRFAVNEPWRDQTLLDLNTTPCIALGAFWNPVMFQNNIWPPVEHSILKEPPPACFQVNVGLSVQWIVGDGP